MAKLLSSLPVGALVKDIETTYNDVSIIWQIMEHGHEGDPEGSTALVTQKIITIKCFDSKEPENTEKGIQEYGNNRYLYSNILQWLNSDATAGQWFSPQHNADAAPSRDNIQSYPYDQEKGFLAYFSDEFKSSLFMVEKKACHEKRSVGMLNTVTYDTVSKKIFLLSASEVGSEKEVYIDEFQPADEGTTYEIFNTDSNRIAYLTQEEADKHTIFKPNEPKDWWLRSEGGSCNFTMIVNSDGGTPQCNSNATTGVRPAIVIPSTLYVSDNADSDGAYTIIWNPPTWTISGEDSSLGNVWQTPIYTYRINNGAGERFTVVEAIDEQMVREITNAAADVDITGDFSGFDELMNEEIHIYTITVTDTRGAVEIRTITFTKLGDKIIFYTNAVETDEAALKIIAEVSYTTEGNPTIKIEATNNAAAVNPVWEDMTNEFLTRTFHTFTHKPADNFGVSVRVTLTKNAATERIYINSLGFSFY